MNAYLLGMAESSRSAMMSPSALLPLCSLSFLYLFLPVTSSPSPLLPPRLAKAPYVAHDASFPFVVGTTIASIGKESVPVVRCCLHTKRYRRYTKMNIVYVSVQLLLLLAHSLSGTHPNDDLTEMRPLEKILQCIPGLPKLKHAVNGRLDPVLLVEPTHLLEPIPRPVDDAL